MFSLIIRRFFQAIPALWIIASATFVLLRLAPGGPFDAEKTVSPEVKLQIEAHYGLDQALHTQYLQYLKNLAQGKLGPSYQYAGWDVDEIIAQAFSVSLELGTWALLIALSIGIPLGVLAALRHNQASETALMTVAAIGICLPSFVLGPILVLSFALTLNCFNPLGWSFPSDRVLPSMTLGLMYAAYIARLARGGMLEVLQNDWIRTARAKGLSSTMVVWRHAMRSAMQPVISFLGPAAAGLISGSFVVETIFFIPGLGPFFVNGALNRDYTLVMGTVLFYAVIIISFNLIVDLIQMWLQPRTRHE